MFRPSLHPSLLCMKDPLRRHHWAAVCPPPLAQGAANSSGASAAQVADLKEQLAEAVAQAKALKKANSELEERIQGLLEELEQVGWHSRRIKVDDISRKAAAES